MMLRLCRSGLFAPLFFPLVPVLGGCANEVVTTSPPPLEGVEGTYVGAYSTEYDDTSRLGSDGWGGTVYFDGTFVLDIDRFGSSLSGTWVLDGAENWDGAPLSTVSMAGTISGELGPEDSVDITFATCGATERFNGRVLTEDGRLSITGRVHLADANCDISFTTPRETVVLRRQE